MTVLTKGSVKRVKAKHSISPQYQQEPDELASTWRDNKQSSLIGTKSTEDHQKSIQMKNSQNHMQQARSSGTAGLGQKPNVLSSQTIQQTTDSSATYVPTKDKSKLEKRYKSREKMQAILHENLDKPQDNSHERLLPQSSKMGMTFGGDDGFYKVPQKMPSDFAADNQQGKIESNLQRRQNKKQAIRSKNSPRNGEECHSIGRNATNELEVIYENDFATQMIKQAHIPQKGRMRDCGNTSQLLYSYRQGEDGSRSNGKKHRIESQCELGKFKQNMLLEFYDWPKIETSAVHAASLKNTIQSDTNALNGGASSVLCGMQDTLNAQSLQEKCNNGKEKTFVQTDSLRDRKGEQSPCGPEYNQLDDISRNQLCSIGFESSKEKVAEQRKGSNAGKLERVRSIKLENCGNFGQSKGFESKFKPSKNEQLFTEGAEKPIDATGKLQIPFLKEIENLQNYQNLKNQQSNSRKRIITVRKVESKALTRHQKFNELRIEKPAQKQNRMSPDTPSQNPFESDLKGSNGRLVGHISKNRLKSKEFGPDNIDSPTFEIQPAQNQREQKNYKINKGQKKNILQLPNFSAVVQKEAPPQQSDLDHDKSERMAKTFNPIDEGTNRSQPSSSRDEICSDSKLNSQRQFKLPLNNQSDINEESAEKRHPDEYASDSKPRVDKLRCAKLDIGLIVQNQQDSQLNNQRSSSMANIEGVPQSQKDDDRSKFCPDIADITKNSTPDLGNSKGKVQQEIHAQTQPRISSQSQAASFKAHQIGTQSNSKFRANPAIATNSRSLQRQVMNDTFSEDAWKKLNTMKLQRQQHQQQPLGQGSKFKRSLISSGANNFAQTLNIVNQKQQFHIGSVKPHTNTKVSLIEEHYIDSRGESNHGQRIYNIKTSSIDREGPLTAQRSFQSPLRDEVDDYYNDENCFSQLTRKQIALKNKDAKPSITEGQLTDRLAQGSIDEPTIQSNDQLVSVFPPDQQLQQAAGQPQIFSGTDMINQRYRQMDVAHKARKSYEQFVFKEKHRDGSEGVTEQSQMHELSSQQSQIRNEGFRIHQHNNRFLSVGFSTQQNIPSQGNSLSKNAQRSGRDCSSKQKIKNDAVENVPPSSDLNLESQELKETSGSGVINAYQSNKIASCIADNMMKQSMNSVVSTGMGDTTNSGNGGTFKKSDASSFTQISSSEFQATKNSSTENEKENNQCIVNQQQVQNGHDGVAQTTQLLKHTKQIFSKQVKTNRVGADQESKRRQFSLGNKYTTGMQNEKSITVRQSMNSKRSTDLFNQKNLSAAVTEAPALQQSHQQSQPKEKLVLPTINTGRKFQIFDVVSFASKAGQNNQANHTNLLSLPLKMNQDAQQVNRFAAGSSQLNNVLLPENDVDRQPSNFHSGQQASQSISALQTFYKQSSKDNPFSAHGKLSTDDRFLNGSMPSTLPNHQGESLTGPSLSTAIADTLNEVQNSIGGRSLTQRQQIHGSKCATSYDRGKHTTHASVTSACHLILQQHQLVEQSGMKGSAGLRQSMHDLTQTQSSSTKQSVNQNRFANINQNQDQNQQNKAKMGY